MINKCLAASAVAAALTVAMTAPAAHAASGKIPQILSVNSGSGVSFDKGLQRRIAKAQAYATSRPGVAGIVVRDRETGAVWRNADSKTHIWGCSTPKLAMVVDLLLRNDSGAIRLTAEDRDLMQKMLHSSDDSVSGRKQLRSSKLSRKSVSQSQEQKPAMVHASEPSSTRPTSPSAI